MSFIKRILCPTDFSAGSKTALAYAIQLAERLNAKVTLVHVAPTPMYVMPGGSFAPMANDMAIIMDSTRHELDAWVENYAEGTTVELASSLRQGDAYGMINAEAETLDVDLIVMGTHGRTGLARLVMGSVAERVVRTSKRPVLTVPSQPAKEEAAI